MTQEHKSLPTTVLDIIQGKKIGKTQKILEKISTNQFPTGIPKDAREIRFEETSPIMQLLKDTRDNEVIAYNFLKYYQDFISIDHTPVEFMLTGGIRGLKAAYGDDNVISSDTHPLHFKGIRRATINEQQTRKTVEVILEGGSVYIFEQSVVISNDMEGKAKISDTPLPIIFTHGSVSNEDIAMTLGIYYQAQRDAIFQGLGRMTMQIFDQPPKDRG